jgi:signal transduction histidine kinase
MNQKLTGFSQQYTEALRTHLQKGSPASLHLAEGLGRKALALGLDTLGLARIHEQAIIAVRLFIRKDGVIEGAKTFFSKANSPIGRIFRAAQSTKVRLQRMKELLDLRTEELAATNRRLQRSVVRRKVMQDTFNKIGKHRKKTLSESLQLQNRLRRLTHRLMDTQESERKTLSRELQNEIAQTLLAINVRLLSLRQEARRNTRQLKEKISSTQRLVARSAQSVRRVAREIARS